METATQTLHRLTSYTWSWYEPSRDEPDLVWRSVPVDDPRVLTDLEVNDWIACRGAGIVEGRLLLLAYAQGASASGMTFIDSEVPATIGEPLDGLLLTCLGAPEYRSAPGGLPGAPTDVRMVTPRL